MGFLWEGIIFTITAARLVSADTPGVMLRVELAAMENGSIAKGGDVAVRAWVSSPAGRIMRFAVKFVKYLCNLYNNSYR